jgi:hypothetical protein
MKFLVKWDVKLLTGVNWRRMESTAGIFEHGN